LVGATVATTVESPPREAKTVMSRLAPLSFVMLGGLLLVDEPLAPVALKQSPRPLDPAAVTQTRLALYCSDAVESICSAGAAEAANAVVVSSRKSA
jgi:hypothetical protein